MTTRTRTSREAQLTALAEQADQANTELLAVLDKIQRLRSATLVLIEDLGGDRQFNWALQADLGYGESQIYALSGKARTVASHARAGIGGDQ